MKRHDNNELRPQGAGADPQDAGAPPDISLGASMHCEAHPDLLPLELLLLDELDDAGRRAVEARLAQCSRCAAVLAHMRHDDLVWRSQMVSGDLPQREAAFSRQDTSRLFPALALAALALIASAATAWVLLGEAPGASTSTAPAAPFIAELQPDLASAPEAFRVPGARVTPLDPGIRAKGEAQLDLELFIRDLRGTRRATPRDSVRPGDRIGFRLTVREAGYIAIAGLDQAGLSYPCFPVDANVDASPIPSAPVAVEPLHAMQLDATPGSEEIVAVHCRSSFSTEALKDSLRSVGTEALEQADWMRERGCSYVRFILDKEES